MYAADLRLACAMQEAVAEVKRLCKERGYLQADGSVYLSTNSATIVTAKA